MAVYSMTGYASAASDPTPAGPSQGAASARVNAELRSVNGR
ncbi:MAG: hypothetical protein RLZZ598_682, partial [Pseudomonadota bacterium]